MFTPVTTQTETTTNLAKSINKALKHAMSKDENVIILGEDVGRCGGVFKVTEEGEDRVHRRCCCKQYQNRFFFDFQQIQEFCSEPRPVVPGDKIMVALNDRE